MATSRNGDKRRPLDSFCPKQARSQRVADMLRLLGISGVADGENVIVAWGDELVTFGLMDSLAGLGHDQLLSVTFWKVTLENVAPTRDQIGKAITHLARLKISQAAA